MIRVFIASPYTKGDVARNVWVQMEAAHRLLDLGACPVWPLASHFLHLHRQRPYKDWTRMDLALLQVCDAVLRLPGDSPGADNEVRVAASLGIRVFHSWEDCERWLKLCESKT